MSLKEQLVGLGLKEEIVEAMEDTQVKAVARQLGLDVPRNVEIVDYKGAKYVKTEGFEVPHKTDPDKTSTARNLFLRVEALDQAITDLMAARELITDDE